MSGVRPEEIAAIACRDWLLMGMPAKVTEVNGLRAATLKSPFAGPFTIATNGTLGISVTQAAGDAGFVGVSLTSGSRTASQLATEINATAGLSGVASADADGRLILTSPSAPTTVAPSVVKLRGNTLDQNTVLGFSRGGQRRVVTALVAPGHDDVIDGWPLLSDLINRGPGTVVVIIGDKITKALSPNVRNEQHLVTMDVSVMRIEPAQQIHRNREHLYASVRCVRELMLSASGRRFGRELAGDILVVRPGTARIVAKPLSLGTKDSPNPLFDAAIFNVEVTVHERPTA